MIQPQSISEQLLFSTVRLETKEGSGTGFFFHFKIDEQKCIPVIITNKHVVNNNQKQQVRFTLHVSDAGKPSKDNIDITLMAEWVFHPKHDLCFTVLQPLLEQIKLKASKNIYYKPFTEDIIWEDSKLEDLNAAEDITMIGYPIGLYDRINNLPLLRKGITASHPALDFNDKGVGVIDCSCFPGSSGSPVVIYNDNGYSDKKGNTYLGAKRFIFIGVLFSGPVCDANGNIEIQVIPTKQKITKSTSLMINLGYYIKAKEILKLKEEALKIINTNNPI